MADADADPNYTAIKLRLSQVDLTVFRWLDMSEVRVGQMWEQVSKHERGMRLEVVRPTGQRWGASSNRRCSEQEARPT
jgi:hypothetical protein